MILVVPIKPETLDAKTEERFFAKVSMLPDAPGCWLWTGSVRPVQGKGWGGYGVAWIDGRRAYAHRVAWVWAHKRPIPQGYVIDHLCRVASCVNPAHLEAVTPRENSLRGDGVGAWAARRTHCPKGHPLDAVTLRVTGQRQRYCSTCNRDRAYAAWEARSVA